MLEKCDNKTLMNLLYSGYISRFKEGILFDTDSNIPLVIINFYLSQKMENDRVSKKIYKNFKTKYILCENLTEGINVTLEDVKKVVKQSSKSHLHAKEELLGLADVYDYIQEFSFDNISNLNIYVLLNIHSKLFAHTKYPEFAGHFRESSARITGSLIELEEYNLISGKMALLYDEFNRILEYKDDIEIYIRKCIRLHAKLIKVHPFFDGNGRSTRALNNLLMAYIGLPPTYIKLEEKAKYCKALEEAIIFNKTIKLEQFFFYKIANAIIETNEKYSDEALEIL